MTSRRNNSQIYKVTWSKLAKAHQFVSVNLPKGNMGRLLANFVYLAVFPILTGPITVNTGLVLITSRHLPVYRGMCPINTPTGEHRHH